MQHKEYMNVPDFKYVWYEQEQQKGNHTFYVETGTQFKPYRPPYAMKMSYPVIKNESDFNSLEPDDKQKFKWLPPFPRPPAKRENQYAPKLWAGNPSPPDRRETPHAPKPWAGNPRPPDCRPLR